MHHRGLTTMITIHYDYKVGNELSYAEGVEAGDHFTTNCLDFFTTDNPANDVIVLKHNGDYISRNELLAGDTQYTLKEIRRAHNIHKMLVAGSFKFKHGAYSTCAGNCVVRDNLEFLIRIVLDSEHPQITMSRARELLGMKTMSEFKDWYNNDR